MISNKKVLVENIKATMKKRRLVAIVESFKLSQKKTPAFSWINELSYNSLCYLDMIQLAQPCTVSQLSGMIGVSKSAVTMKIRQLEKDGYIYKQASTEDKRIKYIYLSEQMDNFYDIYETSDQVIYENIADQFEPEEIEAFCKILDFITDSIEQEIP